MPCLDMCLDMSGHVRTCPDTRWTQVHCMRKYALETSPGADRENMRSAKIILSPYGWCGTFSFVDRSTSRPSFLLIGEVWCTPGSDRSSENVTFCKSFIRVRPCASSKPQPRLARPWLHLASCLLARRHPWAVLRDPASAQAAVPSA